MKTGGIWRIHTDPLLQKMYINTLLLTGILGVGDTSNAKHMRSLKLTLSRWKMDGWQMILSFWGKRPNFKGVCCWFQGAYPPDTRWKMNLEPQNGGLEDDDPLQLHPWSLTARPWKMVVGKWSFPIGRVGVFWDRSSSGFFSKVYDLGKVTIRRRSFTASKKPPVWTARLEVQVQFRRISSPADETGLMVSFEKTTWDV